VVQEVVVQVVDRAVDHMRAPVADTDSVAVRRRVRHSANTDRAPGAGHILDQDRLAERDAHTIAHHARHGVRRAAGRKRNVERDRTCRIALCSGGAWYRRQRGSARDQMQKLSTLKLHHSPPICDEATSRMERSKGTVAPAPGKLFSTPTWFHATNG